MKSIKQNKITRTGLKAWFTALILVSVLGFNATAQIVVSGGTGATAGSPYGTIGAAISAINTGGALTGPVTVDIPAGYTETLTGKVTLTMTGTAANTITIQKSGAGANPVFTSYTGTVATPSVVADGFFVLAGCDYVTIDGINLQEAAGNTTTTTVMEYGFGLFKASATDGCQNNTIQNCSITLNRLSNTGWTAPGHNGSTGIAVLNGLNTASGAVTVTAASGSNSFNKFYSNTIENCNAGIVFIGFAAASPYLFGSGGFGDSGNDVGGTSSGTGNTVLNFGGGAVTNPATGIFANNQWGMNCSYNTVNNNNGSGINHATTLRGIFLNSSSTSASVDCNNNTVTMQGGGTTSLLVGIDQNFGSTAASNTINVNNNTINIGYATATTGVVNAILNSTSAATVNINGNTIQGISGVPLAGTGTLVMIETGSPVTVNTNNNIIQNFIRTGASGPWRGIKITSPTNWNASGNTIENITYSTVSSTGGIDGIYSLSSGVNVSITNNIVRNLSVPTTGTINGIREFGVAGTKTIQNNQVYNFSTVSGGAGGATMNGIFCSTGSVDISGNQIYSLNSTGTTGGTGGTIYGIQISGGTTHNIYKNSICDLSSTSSNPTVGGILNSGGTTITYYNNRIGDLRATAANAANAVIGMNFTGGTTVNAYYNTINLAATSSGALFGSSAVSVSTTPNVTLRNNIFVNTSTANGAGLTVAYRRSTTTLTTYNAASNQNLFYSTGSYFTDGTNTDATFAAYKTRVASRDAASVSEAPNFLSTTCGNANFLKINTAIATQIEGSAAPIAGVTDDFEGDTRNVTTPDIGADEFAGIPSDITGPAISYSLIANTACLTDITLSAIITDASLVNTAPGTKPRLYFKKSGDANAYVGNTNSDNGWKYVEATNASSPFSFTTDYSLLQSAVVPADVIEYFVVAEDLAGTPNVGIYNGTFASAASSVALTGAQFPIGGIPNSYVINNTIPTSVTIGVAETYPTLTGAGGLFDDLNNNALSGNTVATIVDASITEPGTVALNQISYGCATYTLTIKPQTTSTLTGTVGSGAIIKLNGADNVIIDGSNSGGTDRSLTIQNTTTTTSGNAVVWLASPALGNGSTNNIIKNCIIEGNSSTTSFTGIHVGGNTTIGIATAGTERNSNNTIQNNLFRKSIYGVTMFGYGAGTPDLNNVITQNNFGTATAGEGFSLLAINADRQQNLVVSYNEVQNVRNATNTSSTPYGGIRLLDFKDGQCFNNNIHDLAYSGTSTPKIYGIAVTSSSYTTVGNPSNALVYNNTVSRINSTGTSSVWNLTGILASAGYGDRYYNNSVHLTGQLSNTTSGLAAAFANGDGNITTVCTNIDVRNNIFNLEGTTTGGNVWAYYSAATTLAGSTLNYNNLRCAGTVATNNIGRFNSTNYTSLAAWQTATGQEANSVSIAPVFASNTDLHLDLGSNSSLDNLGTPLAAVTIDIDGTTRSVTTPDMGADEFTAVTCSGAIGGTASGSTSFCNSGTPTITASGYSFGAGSAYQWVSSTNAGDYPLAGTPIGGQTNPATLTTGVVSTTTYYWLVVSCTSGLATDYSTMITITIDPSVASITGATSKCASDPAVTLTENGGTGTSWLWSTSETTQSISVNPSSTTTYTVTVTSPGSCTATATHSITVNPNPTGVTAASDLSAVCNGGSINLTSSANSPSPNILAQDFESGIGSWTIAANSTGGANPALANFNIRAHGWVSGGTTPVTMNSPGATNFIFADPDAAGSGVTLNTQLTSPSFSTVGFSSASLDFRHYYRHLTTSQTVQISTNGGGSWTTLQTYSATVGLPTAFANASISLNAYLGQPNVQIRFNYTGGWIWYWAIDDIAITGTPAPLNYSWTSTPSGFTSAVQNPTGVTPTVATDYTVTVTGPGGCTATASTGVVTVNDLPTATISGDASICSGNSTNLTLNFTGTAPWTYAINGGAPATTSNNPETVAVSPVSTTVYTITSLSDANCTGSGSGSATVTVFSAAPDFLISYQPTPPSACAGNIVTLTVNPVNNAESYSWSAPAGTLINGQVSPVVTTSNSVTVTLGAVAANGSGWSICVFASNPCGVSQTKCAFIRGALSAPAAITGSKTACASSSQTYSTNTVGGANSYIWTGTNGITFTGSGTTITANFPSGFTTGTICVAGQLSCGYTGPQRCLTVTNTVATLGTMSGAFAVCPGQTGLVFSIPAVAGAATYTWTTPAGVTVTSGAGTNSVTVSVNNSFTVGNICVTATSICGIVSPQRCKTISSIKPNTPGNIVGNSTGVCNAAVTYSVTAVAGVTSYNWTAPAGATFATPNGTNTIDVTFPSNFTTGQLCVVAVNGCGSSASRCINIKGAPGTAGTISDPGVVCANDQGIQFTITPVFGATNYNWTVPAGANIVAGQGTTTLTVDWGTNSGTVGVTASNSCGNSGTRTRSVVITCRNSSSILPSAEVVAYPNPVSSELTVEMNTLSAGNYSLTMTDLTGRVMLQQAFAANEGKNESKLDVSNYAKGVYLLTVKSETGFTKQIRVTVQ